VRVLVEVSGKARALGWTRSRKVKLDYV